MVCADLTCRRASRHFENRTQGLSLIGHDTRVTAPKIPQYHELMWPALQATKEMGGSATVSEMNERAMASAESGPLITLSGEADVTNAAELSELVTGQLGAGTLHLTIDASGLTFADTAALRVLVLAARTLRQRSGGLVLLGPPRTLVRVMEITGTDEMFTIHGVTEPRSKPEP